jgi:tetratricopeptide (TPR) repeat protein
MNNPTEILASARIALKEGDSEKAIKLLEDNCLKENASALFLMGEIFYNRQEWGSALNSFRRCQILEPNQKAAQAYIDLIMNILGFFHTDQFNP